MGTYASPERSRRVPPLRPLSVVEGFNQRVYPVVGVSTSLNHRGLCSGWGFDFAQPAGLPVIRVSTSLNHRGLRSRWGFDAVYPERSRRAQPPGFFGIYSGLNAIWIDVQLA